MKYGMNNYKREDDIALEPVAPAESAEVMAEASEAQGDIQEVVQLCDAIEEYSSVSTDLDTVQEEAQEVIAEGPSEAEAEEAAVKLERDVNAILSRINGSVKKSRFGEGSFGRRIESDFKLKGKKGLIAKTESISEMGKKVWESIKAFFAKIWEFLKSLFERFTALFKSNKSVLEGLKKKLESEDDDKYERVKDKAEVSQQLRFFSSSYKEYTKNLMDYLGTMETLLPDVAGKVADSARADNTNSKTEKGKNKQKQQPDGTVVEVSQAEEIADEAAGDMTEVAPVESTESAPEEVKDIKESSKKAKVDDFTVFGGLSKNDFEGTQKVNAFYGYAVTGEGVVGNCSKAKNGVVSYTSKTLKIKSDKIFTGNSSKRDLLIEICDMGIDLCGELDGSTMKDIEKSFNNTKKEAEDAIKEMYDSKDKTGDKAAQKKNRAILTSAVSLFSKVVATAGQQPSQVVTAVRNGMSICEAKK